MIYYYEPTDEFIIINHKFNICEVVTHEELDRLEMMKDRNPPFSEYELRQMFPTKYPQQRHAFSNNKITDQDIQRAKMTPIKNYVKVNSGGFAQCLFHADKNASMKIYEKNYHCFSCHAHGDVISLVQKLYNLSFKEAVKRLI